MNIYTYQKFLIKNYLKNLFLVTLIFMCLSFILNILGEINFFKDLNVGISYPILLTFLNTPSIVFELFPFIFLISTQLFFLNLYENEELNIFKIKGLNNLNLLKIISFTSVVTGIFIILFYYGFSSSLKSSYLKFKNKFTKDNEYLAIINDNGLWIKEELNNEVNIINAEIYNNGFLEKIEITKFNNKNNVIDVIIAEKADIRSNTWRLENVFINTENQPKKFEKIFFYSSYFDHDKIKNLFSNLSSLNLLQLRRLIKDYKALGYSDIDLKSHLHKLYSLPFYVLLMTIIGSIVMFNVKYNKSKSVNIIIGIFISALIYYLNYFSSILGTNERIPIILSVWLPYFMLTLICLIGVTKLNEK